MDLLCYLHPGWKPLLRPAKATREWMDQTPESFAYRCLPLNIANAHGWEVLTPFAFDACWKGGITVDDIEIRVSGDAPPELVPISLFGQGVLTFHIFGLFRTPPGWNLWVTGPTNRFKDGLSALTGVIETDWSPYTFTMNWRFTRPDHWVHFEAEEPICFLFPIQRDYLEEVRPRLVSMDSDPALMAQFKSWSKSRDEFHEHVSTKPLTPADKWQKFYYRGVDMTGRCPVSNHRTKLRLAEFTVGAPVGPPVETAPVESAPGLRQRTPLQPSATRTISGPTSFLWWKSWRFLLPEDFWNGRGLAFTNRSPPGCRIAGQRCEPRCGNACADPIISSGRASAIHKRKREWLLESIEGHRELASSSSVIERHCGLTGEDFLASLCCESACDPRGRDGRVARSGPLDAALFAR